MNFYIGSSHLFELIRDILLVGLIFPCGHTIAQRQGGVVCIVDLIILSAHLSLLKSSLSPTLHLDMVLRLATSMHQRRLGSNLNVYLVFIVLINNLVTLLRAGDLVYVGPRFLIKVAWNVWITFAQPKFLIVHDTLVVKKLLLGRVLLEGGEKATVTDGRTKPSFDR